MIVHDLQIQLMYFCFGVYNVHLKLSLETPQVKQRVESFLAYVRCVAPWMTEENPFSVFICRDIFYVPLQYRLFFVVRNKLSYA